ncbi:Abi family protein [Collinsella tanakaei]|nr:Abi family protein [Collinsella tanakaei]
MVSEGKSSTCNEKANAGTLSNDSTQHARSDAANQAGSFFVSMKPFLTIDEQLERLNSHGIRVEEPAFAAQCLRNLNYYRLRAYWMTFEHDDVVAPGTTFQDVWDIYCLDRDVRSWLWNAIEPIELKFRTQFAYCFAKECGPVAYLDAGHFANEADHSKSMDNFRRELSRARQAGEPCVLHNLEKYGELPVWAAVEIMSMGLVSNLFGNLQNERKLDPAAAETGREIADSFGLSPRNVKSWMHHLCSIRNICGHHNRFYNRIMRIRPKLLRRDVQYSGNKEFPTFMVLKRMYERSWPEQWSELAERLTGIIGRYPGVSLDPMGFPPDWKDVLMGTS